MREMSRSKRRQVRHKRIRRHLRSKEDCPRLVILRSLRNIFAQVVDDAQKKTMLSFSTLNKEIKEKFPYQGNITAAKFFGGQLAEELKKKGFTKVVFDRAGHLYHGRVKAVADSLRKGGISF